MSLCVQKYALIERCRLQKNREGGLGEQCETQKISFYALVLFLLSVDHCNNAQIGLQVVCSTEIRFMCHLKMIHFYLNTVKPYV